MDPKTFGGILILMGIFVLIASISNWNWYFEHRKAKFFISILGHTGARIFYIILGIVFIIIGILAYLDKWN